MNLAKKNGVEESFDEARMRQKTVPGMKKQQTGTNMAAGRMHKTLFLQKLTGQYCSRCLQN